jgi:hypothetical protein
MATLSSGRGGVGGESELVTGDRMSREEFHRIYAATPDAFHAELIGGIVYVPSPLKRSTVPSISCWEASSPGMPPAPLASRSATT